MPNPARTSVHVDAPLSTFAMAYISELGYVASKIPVVRVAKQSDKYFIFDKAEWFRDEARVRGPGAESAGGGFRVSTSTYFCDDFAFHQDVDDRTASNADAPIQLERDAARYVAHMLALRAEKQLASDTIGASAWGGSGAPSPTWDDIASTPIENIRAQSNGIIEKTGFKPNTIIAGAEVHKRLVDHPDILDRIKYTQKGVVSADILAGLFEVDNYWVDYATTNSSQEGATASYDFVGNSGLNMLLLYLNPNPSLLTAPTALTRFQWGNMYIKRFRMEELNSWRIEGVDAYDFKVTGSDLGYEFTSAVAS